MNLNSFIKHMQDFIFFQKCDNLKYFDISAVKFGRMQNPWDKSVYFSPSWDSVTTKCC